MSRTRVVVTGLGTTSPLGGDVPSTWEALLEGRSGVRTIDEPWVEDLPVKIAGRVAVEPTEVLERVKARRLDRSAQFAMVAAMEAWRDAGFSGAAGSEAEPGLDGLLDPRGSGLSGGERRRIALVRALLSPAPLCLLDEPTAHLDAASETALTAVIQRLCRGRTALIVTHSAGLAAIADRVVELPGTAT